MPLTIFAQNSLRVKVLNPPLKLKPGEYFTIFVEVSGTQPFENGVETTLLLPNNWNLLMTRRPTIFKGESVVKFIFTIASSSLTPKGIYNIGVNASGKGYEGELENQTIEIEQIRNIEIFTANLPEFVKEGDSVRTEFIIQNLGNNPEKLAIKSLHGKIELPTKDSVKIDSVIVKKKKKKKENLIENISKIDTIVVGANESYRFNVFQVIPITNQNSWSASIDIQALMKDSINAISKVISIPVFSSKTKKNDPYLRFPLEIGGFYNNFRLGDTQVIGFQYDIRGKGNVDFKKNHFIDFVIHGPNRTDIPIASNFDQYSLEYTYKKSSILTLGDYNLRVSNLLEFGRFGRGFRYEQDFKKVNFIAFYIKPRLFPTQRDTYGGTITLKPTNTVNISLNYLSKNLFDDRLIAFDANFYSVVTKVLLTKFNLENEVATSDSKGIRDFGFFNRLNWRFGRFNYNNDFVFTGKNFDGFYKDSYLLINSLSLFLNTKLSLNLTSNITRINPSLDLTVFNTSPFSQSNMLSLNYQVTRTNRLFLSYETREREDKTVFRSFHFKENFGRLAYYITAPKFLLWLDSRYGTAQNLLIKVDSSANNRFTQISIQPQVKVLPWLWLGTYIDYQRISKFSDDNTIRNFYYYGGNARITFSNIFNANFNYRNNYAPDELFEKRTFIDLNANLNLGNHHFSLTGGSSYIPLSRSNSQTFQYYSLRYTFKFNAPIARNKKLSNIKGQIIGMNGVINPRGIIVQMGEKRFMTDTNGLFQFNDLMPDKYYINLVQSSLDRGVVSTVRNPLEVIVKADTSYKIDIPLTKTGTILGKINFQKSEAIGATDIISQKPLVIVKLFNENESFLTQVNKKDEFSFKEIKPGKWKIIASIPGKLDQFSVQNTDQFIDLESDKIYEVSINIVPNERKIQFSNKTIKLSTKK